MYRVFLSHSRRDNSAAQAVFQWLTEAEPSLKGEIFLDVNPRIGFESPLHPQQLRQVAVISIGLDPADRRLDQREALANPSECPKTLSERDIERRRQELVPRLVERRQTALQCLHPTLRVAPTDGKLAP